MQTCTNFLENGLAYSDKDDDTPTLWSTSCTLEYVLKKLMRTFTPTHDKFLMVSILVFCSTLWSISSAWVCKPPNCISIMAFLIFQLATESSTWEVTWTLRIFCTTGDSSCVHIFWLTGWSWTRFIGHVLSLFCLIFFLYFLGPPQMCGLLGAEVQLLKYKGSRSQSVGRQSGLTLRELRIATGRLPVPHRRPGGNLPALRPPPTSSDSGMGEVIVHPFSSCWSLGSPDNETHVRGSNISPPSPNLEFHVLMAWKFSSSCLILIPSLVLSHSGFQGLTSPPRRKLHPSFSSWDSQEDHNLTYPQLLALEAV